MSCRYYLFPRQIIYLFFLLWTYCNVIDSCCREIIRLRGKYRTTSETINKSTIIAIILLILRSFQRKGFKKMEKKYYILQKEAYSIYPQVDCLSVFQAQQISSWKIFSGIKPKLSFRLKKKAKFTDVLSSTAGPFTDFLISSKVKEIIDSSHVMQHQFFEASIKTNDQEYEYYWLHLSQPNLVDALNYEESEFYQTEWEFLNKGPIKIKSYEHYMKLKAKDEDGSFGVSLNQYSVNSYVID